MSEYQAAQGMKTMQYEAIFGLTETDRAMLERVQKFIPDKVFDAHAHLHHVDFVPKTESLFTAFGTANAKRLLEDQKVIYGDRQFRALLLPTPTALFNEHPEMRRDMNRWMVQQLEEAPNCAGAVYVMPGDTVEEIEAMLTHPRVRGFKCYHQSAAANKPTFYCEIGEYLPESAWQVADKRGMTITLHMVKPLALADTGNMEYIRTMTAKYPNAKLIWPTVPGALHPGPPLKLFGS